MAGLADFRAQHPEYNDMSDNALADSLHAKFYSDMPKDTFDAKMGLSANPPGPQPSTLDQIEASPVGRAVHDIGGSVVGGAAKMATMFPLLAGAKPGVDMISNAIEGQYQGALARNRNTPGYAAARQGADTMASQRGAGGFTDQMLAPFNPTLAGLSGLLMRPNAQAGALDSANAAADAQTAAQDAYRKANPKTSMAAGVLGGMLAAPKLPIPTPGQTAPSIADLNSAKDAAYSAVDNSPMKIASPEIKKMVVDLRGELAKRGLTEDTMSGLAPRTNTALTSLENAAGSDQTLQGMEMQRRIAGAAAGSIDKTDRAAARIIQDHIDDFVTNLQPSQLSGPVDQQALNALPVARDLAKRSFKTQQIQGIIDKAGNNSTGFAQSGYENALRSGFRKLLNNDRAIARFSPVERAAIKQVATGGSALSATNLLRQVGKLSPQGAIPLLAETGAVLAGGPQMLAVPAAGLTGRMGATALTKAAAMKALNTAALGNTAAAIPSASMLSLPSLPAAGSLPYGLLLQRPSVPANQ
jgi:hypothetical protein